MNYRLHVLWVGGLSLLFVSQANASLFSLEQFVASYYPFEVLPFPGPNRAREEALFPEQNRALLVRFGNTVEVVEGLVGIRHLTVYVEIPGRDTLLIPPSEVIAYTFKEIPRFHRYGNEKAAEFVMRYRKFKPTQAPSSTNSLAHVFGGEESRRAFFIRKNAHFEIIEGVAGLDSLNSIYVRREGKETTVLMGDILYYTATPLEEFGICLQGDPPAASELLKIFIHREDSYLPETTDGDPAEITRRGCINSMFPWNWWRKTPTLK